MEINQKSQVSQTTQTIQALCRHYEVDMAHARYVAALALEIFDITQDVHTLDARSRELARAGALLHNVGLSVDEANHHTVGRDIVVGANLKGFSTAERNILACIVSFHRKSVHPDEELLFRVLSQDQQRQCLMLSALVRVADGLDYSQTQSTAMAKVRLGDVEVDFVEKVDTGASTTLAAPDSAGHSSAGYSSAGHDIHIKTKGPHSYDDALRADKKADLWNHLFDEAGSHLTFSGQLKSPGLTPDDTLAAAGRKLMRYHFVQRDVEAWRLKLDPKDIGSNSKDQAASIKKLRVGLRRLRSTALAFGEYYREKHTGKLFEGMRALGRILGAAREADMLVERAEGYAAACDAEVRDAFQPFIQQLKSRRDQAYHDVLTYAHKPAHQDWVDDFQAFVLAKAGGKIAAGKADRELDVDRPSRVRHAAQAMFWQYVASVRAFDVLPDQPDVAEIHALRIAIKRLRYLAQGLAEVLPAEVMQVWVAHCKHAQDVYGAIQDAHMAAEDARQFARTAQEKGRVVHVKAIETYVAEQTRMAAEQLPAWRAVLEPLLQDAPAGINQS